MADTLNNITIRTARLEDAEAVAKLHCLEKTTSWQTFMELFRNEFSICTNHPDERTYFLAFSGDELVGYAGARYYQQTSDENMYGTSNLLPSGWYLRGIKTHPDWRRQGLAKTMTLKRLEWLSLRSNLCFVFLDDENKISLPMYFELGFEEVSRGWTFSDATRKAKSTLGILLKKTV